MKLVLHAKLGTQARTLSTLNKARNAIKNTEQATQSKKHRNHPPLLASVPYHPPSHPPNPNSPMHHPHQHPPHPLKEIPTSQPRAPQLHLIGFIMLLAPQVPHTLNISPVVGLPARHPDDATELAAFEEAVHAPARVDFKRLLTHGAGRAVCSVGG